jgi:CubicO group peptidase (beta-lactamase class C family)
VSRQQVIPDRYRGRIGLPQIVFLCLVFSCSIVTGSASARSSDDSNSGEDWISHQLDRFQIPGVIGAVVHADDPIRTFAAGSCSLESNRGCDADIRMPLGSVTKTVTGLLAALLAYEGKIELDAPITDYWPEFRLSDDRWKRITLRDLLGHRTGMGSIDWPFIWEPSRSRSSYLRGVESSPMLGAFRSGFHYSNANFVVAGRVMELATGVGLERLIETRILDPVGLHECGFSNDAVSDGYALDHSGTFQSVPEVVSTALAPAGGLNCTARSFARLLQLLLQNGRQDDRRILPAAAITTLRTVVTSFGRAGGYGLGANLTRLRGFETVNHLGSSPGYSAAFLLVPEKQFGAIVMINRTASIFPDALAVALFEQSIGGDAEATIKQWMGNRKESNPRANPSSARSRAAPERYKGCYQNPAWGRFDVQPSKDRLTIQMGTLSEALIPHEDRHFLFRAAREWEWMTVEFVSNAAGAVTGFNLLDGTHPEAQLFTRGCSQ